MAPPTPYTVGDFVFVNVNSDEEGAEGVYEFFSATPGSKGLFIFWTGDHPAISEEEDDPADMSKKYKLEGDITEVGMRNRLL